MNQQTFEDAVQFSLEQATDAIVFLKSKFCLLCLRSLTDPWYYAGISNVLGEVTTDGRQELRQELEHFVTVCHDTPLCHHLSSCVS